MPRSPICMNRSFFSPGRLLFSILESNGNSRPGRLAHLPCRLPFWQWPTHLLPRLIGESIPLVPALQSNWLLAHVITCFVGYAAFAIAAALGIMYLVKNVLLAKSAARADQRSSCPPLKMLDDIIHKSMIFGFIWLSAGIITGAIWANSAWGTYWSWDPKETWSLITWFVYAFTLHARYTRGMERQNHCLAVPYRFYRRHFHLLRCKLSSLRPAQLWLRLIF